METENTQLQTLDSLELAEAVRFRITPDKITRALEEALLAEKSLYTREVGLVTYPDHDTRIKAAKMAYDIAYKQDGESIDETMKRVVNVYVNQEQKKIKTNEAKK